jgi:hypothetical protein
MRRPGVGVARRPDLAWAEEITDEVVIAEMHQIGTTVEQELACGVTQRLARLGRGRVGPRCEQSGMRAPPPVDEMENGVMEGAADPEPGM